VRRLDTSRCDYIFVHVGDGRPLFIPVRPLGGTTRIVLGGSKYAEFEVESSEPLSGRATPAAPANLAGVQR
jgi:hypothetical protein